MGVLDGRGDVRALRERLFEPCLSRCSSSARAVVRARCLRTCSPPPAPLHKGGGVLRPRRLLGVRGMRIGRARDVDWACLKRGRSIARNRVRSTASPLVKGGSRGVGRSVSNGSTEGVRRARPKARTRLERRLAQGPNDGWHEARTSPLAQRNEAIRWLSAKRRLTGPA